MRLRGLPISTDSYPLWCVCVCVWVSFVLALAGSAELEDASRGKSLATLKSEQILGSGVIIDTFEVNADLKIMFQPNREFYRGFHNNYDF